MSQQGGENFVGKGTKGILKAEMQVQKAMACLDAVGMLVDRGVVWDTNKHEDFKSAFSEMIADTLQPSIGLYTLAYVLV